MSGRQVGNMCTPNLARKKNTGECSDISLGRNKCNGSKNLSAGSGLACTDPDPTSWCIYNPLGFRQICNVTPLFLNKIIISHEIA